MHGKIKDAAAHSAVLAHDYIRVHPDGTMQAGKPTTTEIADAAIADYTLSRLQVPPISSDVALVTHFAEVEIPGGDHSDHAQFAVGEAWVKQRDE